MKELCKELAQLIKWKVPLPPPVFLNKTGSGGNDKS